jgi:hypothetical protein
MEFRQLGGSGFRVPVPCLRTGTFGAKNEAFRAFGATDVAATKLIKGYGSGISSWAGGCEPLFTFGHRRLEYSYRAHRCEPGLRAKHI